MTNPTPDFYELSAELAPKITRIFLSCARSSLKDNEAGMVINFEVTKALEQAFKAGREKGLDEAAQKADDLFCGFHSPYEYSNDVSEEIKALKEKEPV